MKIHLNPGAIEALKEIGNRIRAANPYASKHASVVVAQILSDFNHNADKATVVRIADSLVSSRFKRKALLKRLAALAQEDEESALQVLEKSVRKLDRSSIENRKNEAEK